MQDADLGQFAGRIAELKKLMATVDESNRFEVFSGEIVDTVAGLIPEGLARATAADVLVEIAEAHRLGNVDDIQTLIHDGFAKVEDPDMVSDQGPPQRSTNGHGKQEHEKQEPPPKYSATLYVFPDPATIDPRKWLYAGHYVRGAVTATVAPGGFGKTTLILYEIISMTLESKRVWYISGEDPKVEIDRRIAAHCQHHNIDCARVFGNLYVDDKSSFPMFLGRGVRTSVVEFNKQWLAILEHEIRERQIDVVAIDPFISFHSVPEGDNGAIDQIVKMLGIIAQRMQCDIELSHHVRKAMAGAQAELTVDDSRGGTAIINAVRSARVFNRMNANEAALAKIRGDERASYVRVDKGKRNMAPPEKASWWRIVSVLLPNGDNVQAIEPYAFKEAFDGLSSSAMEWVQQFLREGGPRRASSQSPDWLGHHLGTHCGRDDTHEKAGAIWANKIITTWLSNKVIQKLHMRDPDTRKPGVPFYADNNFKPPPDEEERGAVLPFKSKK